MKNIEQATNALLLIGCAGRDYWETIELQLGRRKTRDLSELALDVH